MRTAALEPAMLDVLQGFVHELRLAGLPVSMTENLDAMRAVEFVPLEDRDAVKTALSATLATRRVQDRVERDAREAPGALQGVRHRLRGVLLDLQPRRRGWRVVGGRRGRR